MGKQERYDDRVTIGRANGTVFFHSQCLTAIPTNGELSRMTVEQLTKAAYESPWERDFVRTERYRATADPKAAAACGRRPNEEYDGACRAMIWLEYRAAQRAEARKAERRSLEATAPSEYGKTDEKTERGAEPVPAG